MFLFWRNSIYCNWCFCIQVPACHLSSDITQSLADQIYVKLSMRNPEVRLLYVTPEKVSVFIINRKCGELWTKYNIIRNYIVSLAVFKLSDQLVIGIYILKED